MIAPYPMMSSVHFQIGWLAHGQAKGGDIPIKKRSFQLTVNAAIYYTMKRTQKPKSSHKYDDGTVHYLASFIWKN